MRSVAVSADYQFRISRNRRVQYRAGETYRRVPEMQARAIKAAGCGEFIDEEGPPRERSDA